MTSEEDWPELYEKALMELIKQYPYLYAPEHPLHKNYNAQQNALNDIKNKLYARFPDTNWTEEKLLNKWKYLKIFYSNVKSGKFQVKQSSRAERRYQLLTFLSQKYDNTTDGYELITEFIPLDSLEPEYLDNSDVLYPTEHNEHDYISTVLVENAHEEIVSSTCCDETSIMKTEKDNNEEETNSTCFTNITISDSITSDTITVSSSQHLNTQYTPTKATFVPASIIFSDKTLNTIVLAPTSTSSNSSVRAKCVTASPLTTQTKTNSISSKTESQASRIPSFPLGVGSTTSINHTASLASARGPRTSTILCSSVSPIVSTKQQALRSLTSSSTSCSPAKKIILQNPKQYCKTINNTSSSVPTALVEIHSSSSTSGVPNSNSSSSFSSQSSSTASSPSHTRSVAAASSNQTIVIYTSPSVSSSTGICTTNAASKNLTKTTTVLCTPQTTSALRPSSASAVTAGRTIVIGSSATHHNNNSISSTVRSTNTSLNLRPISSHQSGNSRAINISKHVGTNTVHRTTHRSVGINTQQLITQRNFATTTSFKDFSSVTASVGVEKGTNSFLINKPNLEITPLKSIGASSTCTKVLGTASGQSTRDIEPPAFTAKNALKRQREVSPPLSPQKECNSHGSVDIKTLFSGKKRDIQLGKNINVVNRKSNVISNSDDHMVVSCPSSTNRELQAAIVGGEDAEPLTSTEAEFVRAELVKQLKSTLELPHCPELRFLNSGLVEPGWFMYTCQDSTSLEWLLSLKPMEGHEGRLLHVVKATELPWPSQVGFQIQGRDINADSVISLLQGQNKKLKTKKWNLSEKKEESNGVFLSYFVDPESVKALEEYQWMLCYEFSVINVHLLRGTAENDWRVPKDENTSWITDECTN